jgi:glycosyltransferase involved in cell wall biosynthesis
MKIAHIVNTFPPYWSGTGIAAQNLTVALSKLGHEIHVFIPQTIENEKTNYPGIIVHKLKPLLRFGQAPFTPELLNIRGFDVLHLHFPYYFGGELTSVISKIRNIPEVITYHNDVIKPNPSGLLVNFHYQFVAPRVLNNAKYLFVMSEQFKEESLMSKVFSNNERVRIIPQGVDTTKFRPDVKKQLIPEINDDSPFVLFVRTLDNAHYHSGLNYLIQAMINVKTKCHLVVVGDGELKEYYQQLTCESGVSNRVHFIGKVSNENLPSYYSACTLFVLPSAETENASIVILEAMACGKPVIATEVGGSKQLIDNERNGYLVAPKKPDALSTMINYIIDHPDIANIVGKNARENVVTTSSWEVVAKQVDSTYQCLV